MPHKVLKIGLIDADLIDNGTRHPNLAQMKMSSYCKGRGHAVDLLFKNENVKDFDLVIVSKVFTSTALPKQLQQIIDCSGGHQLLNTSIVKEVEELENKKKRGPVKITLGGTGFFEDGGRDLDFEIEHIMPDYHLYDTYINKMVEMGRNRKYFEDYERYSIGFASRGCFRKCSFCVNKKYDHAFRHAPVSEFLDKSRPFIYLWDDNIFALGDGWESVFKELKDTGKSFQFRQGLDIRLITDEHAKMLAECKYHGDVIFAFDHIRDREIIEDKLKLWRKHCNKTTKLYVLCAYEPIAKTRAWFRTNRECSKKDKKDACVAFELEDVINTFERISILMKYGCVPYIMRYEAYEQSHFRDIYTQLARWCNQPDFFKKKSFREYCVANQEYAKTKDNFCAPYKALIDFEHKYPDIAKKYFDLRYDTTNDYAVMSGYGRNTMPCPVCKDNNLSWEGGVNKTVKKLDLIANYYQRNIDLICLQKCKKECYVDVKLASQVLIDTIRGYEIEDILKIIDASMPLMIKSNEIPQPGNLKNGTTVLLNILGDDELTYEEIGSKMPVSKNTKSNKGVSAYKKYGESYSKFAALLDLVELTDKRPISVIVSPVGKNVKNMNSKEQNEFVVKQILRIPIVQNIIRDAKDHHVKIEDYLNKVVNESTVTRRLTAVKFYLNSIEHAHPEIDKRLLNIQDYW